MKTKDWGQSLSPGNERSSQGTRKTKVSAAKTGGREPKSSLKTHAWSSLGVVGPPWAPLTRIQNTLPSALLQEASAFCTGRDSLWLVSFLWHVGIQGWPGSRLSSTRHAGDSQGLFPSQPQWQQQYCSLQEKGNFLPGKHALAHEVSPSDGGVASPTPVFFFKSNPPHPRRAGD